MNKNLYHILAVDDDDRIRSLVKQFLEKNGFIVTTAKNSEDAKDKLKIIKFYWNHLKKILHQPFYLQFY